MTIYIKLLTSDGSKIFKELEKEMLIGRSSKSDLKLDDKKCSGKHFMLYLDEYKMIVLEDLGSTNGTRLNDQYIKEKEYLYLGDVVEVGSAKIEIDPKHLNESEKKRLTRQSKAKQIDLVDGDESIQHAKEEMQKTRTKLGEEIPEGLKKVFFKEDSDEKAAAKSTHLTSRSRMVKVAKKSDESFKNNVNDAKKTMIDFDEEEDDSLEIERGTIVKK